MRTIDRDTLQDLILDGVLVIEVLPNPEYEEEHIRGAINIPLKQLDARAVDNLDRNSPLVTYCNGFT